MSKETKENNIKQKKFTWKAFNNLLINMYNNVNQTKETYVSIKEEYKSEYNKNRRIEEDIGVSNNHNMLF